MTENSANPFEPPRNSSSTHPKPARQNRSYYLQIAVGASAILFAVLCPYQILNSLVGGFAGTLIGFRFVKGPEKHILFGLLGALVLFTIHHIIVFLMTGVYLQIGSVDEFWMLCALMFFSIPGSLAAMLLSMLIVGRTNL